MDIYIEELLSARDGIVEAATRHASSNRGKVSLAKAFKNSSRNPSLLFPVIGDDLPKEVGIITYDEAVKHGDRRQTFEQCRIKCIELGSNKMLRFPTAANAASRCFSLFVSESAKYRLNRVV